MFLLLLLACGDSAISTKTAVGGACTADAGCQDGLFCETRIKGGLCTHDCTPPNTGCPSGAQCVQVIVETVNASAYRCLAECDDTRPCRTDSLWTCRQAGSFMVCAPGAA